MDTANRDLVYYLHIPKTSGTSLHATFVRAVGEKAASRPLLWDDLVDGKFELTPEIQIVTGHFGGLFPLWLGRWPRIITILRSPIERALSHINHVQRNEGHPLHAQAKGLDIPAYCEHPILRSTIDNLQSRHLASLDFSLNLLRDAPSPSDQTGLSRSVRFTSVLSSLDASAGLLDAASRALSVLDAIGICEEQEKSVDLFARVLAWDPSVVQSQPPRLNTALSTQKTVADLTPAELEALQHFNDIDLKIYEHAKVLFDRQRQSKNASP